MTAVAIQVREKVELGIDRWCTPACCSVLVLLLVRSGRRLTTTPIPYFVLLQGRHLPVPEGDSERFPPGVTTLLEGCWATDASSRLSASEVAARCRQLLGQLINTKGEDLEE
jgi:hypothetical protein